jgi:hypothetical protein
MGELLPIEPKGPASGCALLPTPFVAGERALLRAPIIEDETIIANTNEEAVVEAIGPDVHVCGRSASIAASPPGRRTC